MFLVRAITRLVSGQAHAADRSERAVHEPHDLPDGNLAGGLGEAITAMLATLALDKASLAQLLHDLLKEFDGQVFRLRQFRHADQ